MMADIFFQSESFISIDSTKPRKKVTATFRHVVRPRRRGVHLWLNLDRRTERRCTHARTSTLKRSSAAQVEEFVLEARFEDDQNLCKPWETHSCQALSSDMKNPEVNDLGGENTTLFLGHLHIMYIL